MSYDPGGQLLDGEDPDLHKEIGTIVADPDQWLDQPNDQLGGEKPRDMLTSPDGRQHVRDLVRAIKHGMPT